MAATSSIIDRIQGQRYEVRELLGEGSTGQVYRVFDRQSREERAIKLIDVRNRNYPLETILRFKAEAQTVRSLNHPDIVHYVDFFEEQDIYGLVMDYVSSYTLEDYLKEHGSLDPARVVHVMKGISGALLYLHDQSIVHHDLKSSNISVIIEGESLRVRVLDFGLAHLVGATENHVAGTLAYMAPEQTGMLNKIVDHRADLYALGIIAYQALVGRLPFLSNDPAILMHEHIATTPEPPSRLRDGVPPALEKIILKLMSKDPDDRYRTTAGIIKDLERFEREAMLGAITEVDFTPGLEDHWESFPRKNPFLNRASEIADLQRTFADSEESGGGRVVFIEGMSGIGKTALLQEVYNEESRRGRTQWFHTVLRESTGQQYKTLANIIRKFLKFLKAIDSKKQVEIVKYMRSRLGELFPLFYEMIPELESWLEGNAPKSDRAYTANDYANLFYEYLRLSARYMNRLILYLDDAHNLEPESANAILARMRDINSLSVVLVCSYDHSRLSRESRAIFEQWAASDANAKRMHIEPLTESVFARLLQELFSNKLPQATDLLEPLYHSSGGNPGYMRNQLQNLIDQNAIYYEDSTWKVNLEQALRSLGETQTATRADVLQNFTTRQTELLRYCAVFERAFTLDAVEYLLRKIEPECSSSALKEWIELLDRAESEGLLAITNSNLYVFRDHVIRRLLRRQLDAAVRYRCHAAIADFLQEHVLPRSEDAIYDIAHHREMGGDFLGAMNAYVKSAKMTDNGRFSNRQAMIYYQLAVRMLDRVPPGEVNEDQQFQLRYNAVHHVLQITPRQEELWDQLKELEEWTGDNKQRKMQLMAMKVTASWGRGRRDDMYRYADELLALGTEPEDEPYIVGTYAFLGTVPGDKTYAERLKILRNGLEMATRVGQFELIATSLVVATNIAAYLGLFEDAERYINDTVENLEKRIGQRALLGAVFPKSMLAAERGEFARQVEVFEGADIEGMELSAVARLIMNAHMARALGMVGRVSEALKLYDQLLPRGGDTSRQGERPIALHGRIMLSLHTNDVEEALDYVEDARRHMQLRPDRYMSALFEILGSEAFVRLGQFASARQCLEEASRLESQLDSPLLAAHLDFALARLHFHEEKSPQRLKEADEVLERLLAMGVTGYHEIYQLERKRWERGTDSTSTVLGSSENRELMQLMQINRKISSTLNLDVLLGEVLKGAMQITGSQHGYLFVCDEDDAPHLQLARDTRGEDLASSDYMYSRTILFEVIRTRAAVVTRDARHDARWNTIESVVNRGLRSILSAPIILQDRILGVLYLDNHEASQVFTIRDREIVENFATQVAIAMNNARTFAREQETREQMESTLQIFERFVPKQFTQRFAGGNLELLKTGLSTQEKLTILFSDIRSFTTLAESMTPGETFLLLNDYLARMEQPIRNLGGFVDKFMGDAIMALFDAEPVSAVKAGLAMMSQLEQMNDWRRNKGLAPLRIGVGINTGEVMIGVIGSAERMDTTVMGDAVNTASRIESLTKYYGADLLIGGDTYKMLMHDPNLYMRLVDEVQVKGKGVSTSIYEIFNADREAIREQKLSMKSKLEEARAAYRAGEFGDAQRLFEEYAQRFPEDKIVAPFIDRCRIYQQLRPEDWKGVYRLESK